jgi:hypothetical protein
VTPAELAVTSCLFLLLIIRLGAAGNCTRRRSRNGAWISRVITRRRLLRPMTAPTRSWHERPPLERGRPLEYRTKSGGEQWKIAGPRPIADSCDCRFHGATAPRPRRLNTAPRQRMAPLEAPISVAREAIARGGRRQAKAWLPYHDARSPHPLIAGSRRVTPASRAASLRLSLAVSGRHLRRDPRCRIFSEGVRLVAGYTRKERHAFFLS